MEQNEEMRDKEHEKFRSASLEKLKHVGIKDQCMHLLGHSTDRGIYIDSTLKLTNT